VKEKGGRGEREPEEEERGEEKTVESVAKRSRPILWKRLNLNGHESF
jgi:hypothetical protein